MFFRAVSYVWQRTVRYAVKFGVVGLIGFVIDTGIFNLLRLGLLGHGDFVQSALGAKLVSTSVAIICNWVGNRYWTFREHRRRNVLQEFVEYVVVSIGGLLIGLLCLWFTNQVLGLTSLLADNISANIVGLILGMFFRFVLYRYWVYGHHRSDGISAESKVEEAELALFVEPENDSNNHGSRSASSNPA
jgi:putative flippase GtrA